MKIDHVTFFGKVLKPGRWYSCFAYSDGRGRQVVRVAELKETLRRDVWYYVDLYCQGWSIELHIMDNIKRRQVNKTITSRWWGSDILDRLGIRPRKWMLSFNVYSPMPTIRAIVGKVRNLWAL